MGDEGGVKAPVTRLRRRLSVEQSDDARLSPAPNTPTKKRGGRRTVKPELDLIDENAPENNTPNKITKKANMKELDVEEKPVTPSRRSARIRSNTSIVLETTQPTVDSPRAKRATRRNSQIGSDNEAPLTPARATRRTRRDSANADKVETQAANKTMVPVTEIIVEEPETITQKNNSDNSIDQNHSPSGLRKSPRLSLKKNKVNDSIGQTEKEISKPEKQIISKVRQSTELNEKDKSDEQTVLNKESETFDPHEKEITKSDEHNTSNKENESSQDNAPKYTSPIVKLIDINKVSNDEESSRHSISNLALLDKLNNEHKKKHKNVNKSSSALYDNHTEGLKNKRHRTKSWAGLSEPLQNDNKSFSDSENRKKTNKNLFNSSRTGDAQNVSKNIMDDSNSSCNEETKHLHDISVQKEKILSPLMHNLISSTNLFAKEPTNFIQTVSIEESDSNSENITINQETKKQDREKEKSPIVSFNKYNGENITVNKNDSCEPMDVDETLSDNIISTKSLLKNLNMSENTVSSNVNIEFNNSVSKKSESSTNLSQTLDKTTNENKSTLVISQLKDITNENNLLQSPQIAVDPKSQSDSLNITQDNVVDKKIVSSNYLTSTPLQQKGLLKHALHVNNSGIISNNTSKIDQSCSNLNVSNTNKSNIRSEESGSDESSQEKSNFEDDEAEDAGDDYESGDSRDEEDKQYERDHEIVQKGETLTSEEELSNDSDYEKDSFVVSSDEEDDELLDGSGDDLSTSDNELKMTAKSKKKYNERKIKEQKKASREMFESRHKLNVSDKSNKSHPSKIKKNRAVLDSTDSEDEHFEVKMKKNKRIRLDSSHETNINELLETSKTKLDNSLPKPVNDENNTNEVEMTMVEHDGNEEIDPLSEDVKIEPKTPQKDLENTLIQFVDPTQSDNPNKSNLNMTSADDPLEEADISDSSESSSNEHIQNYDSVLNELNKSIKSKKNKEGDISLNIEMKPKQKTIPIVDQLNLTQTQLKKKKQSGDERKKQSENRKSSNDKSKIESNNTINKSLIEKINHKKKMSVSMTTEHSDNESSASIDLHLLFSEDSNNSDNVKIKDKVVEQNDEDESFIPLRKSQGKTDIFDTSALNNKSHTDCDKKMKKKNKSLAKSNIENEDCVDGTEVQFFLDTTGTHNSTAVDETINASTGKKKKEKRKAIEQEESDSDAPMEVLNKSVMSQGQQVNVVEVMNTSLAALHKSKIKTPKSDKKKKRTESLTTEQTVDAEDQPIDDDIEKKINHSGIADKSINKSMTKTPKSERKKAKKISESQTTEEATHLDSDASSLVANKSLTKGQQEVDIEEVTNSSLMLQNKSINKTPKSDKKKRKTSESKEKTDEQVIVESPENDPQSETEKEDTKTGLAEKSMNKSLTKTPKSDKKKKKLSESQPEIEISLAEKSINKSLTKTPKYDKKERKLSESQPEIEISLAEKSINKSLTKTPKYDKKERKLSESQPEIEINSDINETISKTSFSEKKKSKKLSESSDGINMFNVGEDNEVSKKRKRKSSLNDIEKEVKVEDQIPTLETSIGTSTGTVNKNKKRKITHSTDDSENRDQAPKIKTKLAAIEKQRNQEIVKQKLPLHSQFSNMRDETDINLSNKKGNKKRKREDDEGSKISKVLKANTAELQVPRLPASILNKLEDKPAKKNHQVIKPKAISTTNFVVEETKVTKTKPSSYLEESVYLNDDEEGESKKQKYIKNPKVLPFLPTVSTSNSGYTTNFKINVLPKQIQFVAKSTTTSNYKNDYLQSKKIKRLGTYELYKRMRNVKMSKF